MADFDNDDISKDVDGGQIPTVSSRGYMGTRSRSNIKSSQEKKHSISSWRGFFNDEESYYVPYEKDVEELLSFVPAAEETPLKLINDEKDEDRRWGKKKKNMEVEKEVEEPVKVEQPKVVEFTVKRRNIERVGSWGSSWKRVAKVPQRDGSYKYEPIRPFSEIRILKLYCGRKGDPLRGSIFRSSLRSTKSTSNFNCYTYHALSFDWGDPQFTDQIILLSYLEEQSDVEIATVSIGANLAAALQSVRNENGDIDLWVDALCIDQTNIVECSALKQLLLREIYEGAISTFVWLSGSGLDPPLAFKFLRLLAGLRPLDDLPNTKSKPKSWASVRKLAEALSRECVQTLDGLKFPTPNIQVFWGSESMEKEDMKKALFAILARRKQVRVILQQAEWDHNSIKSFFHMIPACFWSQPKLSTRSGTTATEIKYYDSEIEKVPEFQSHLYSEQGATLGQPDRHIETRKRFYQCDFQGCGFEAVYRKDLYRHKFKHEVVWEYYCPVRDCSRHLSVSEFGFTKLHNAKRHIKQHTIYNDLKVVRVNNLERLSMENDLRISSLAQRPEPSRSVQLEESNGSESDFSITSHKSSAVSKMASSATSISNTKPRARDSAREISDLISNDDQLRGLLEKAFDLIDPEKFTRNFRRILHSFSKDLMLEATTPAQEQVAKFTKQKSRQITVLIRENFLPAKPLVLPDHNVDVACEKILQDYLQDEFLQLKSVPNVSLAPLRNPRIIGEKDAEQDEEEEEEEEEDDDDDYDDYLTESPDLTNINEWFLSASAMENLRIHFRLFLTTIKPTNLDNSERVEVFVSPTRDSDDYIDFSKDTAIFETPEPKQSTKMLVIIPVLKKASRIWNYINAKQTLEPGLVRLNWTCNCGYTSHDDFRELRPGAVAAYARKLVESGYVTYAEPANSGSSAASTLIKAARNKVAAAGRSMAHVKLGGRGRNPKPKARKFADIQCSSNPGVICKWLHLCLKQRPSAKVTKLESLHVCKDDEQQDLTDASFFKALRKAWKIQRSWIDLILFKLTRIEFIKFSAFPDNSVDRIVADVVPPTTDHYDFAPPPPLDMVPPIAADHMVHLILSECTPSMQSSSFYLSQLPKKKEKPLKFSFNQELNTGYGLRFVEVPDSSFIVTFLFLTAVVIGTVFGVCWTVFKKDMQDAWTFAAYFVSVMALAVVTWQIRATS